MESFQELVQAVNDDDDETVEDEDEIDELAFELNGFLLKKSLEILKNVRSFVQQEGRIIDNSNMFASAEMKCICSISNREMRLKTITDYLRN